MKNKNKNDGAGVSLDKLFGDRWSFCRSRTFVAFNYKYNILYMYKFFSGNVHLKMTKVTVAETS